MLEECTGRVVATSTRALYERHPPSPKATADKLSYNTTQFILRGFNCTPPRGFLAFQVFGICAL